MSKYKRKQSNIISSLKRKNNRLIEDLRDYVHENKQTISEAEKTAVDKFNRRIYKCANISLYRENMTDREIDFLAAHTCKSKTCFVCNFLRQKSLRRKYGLWFKDNQIIYELESKKSGRTKVTTHKQYQERYEATHIIKHKHEYDLMHLTLTVPHTEQGFLGQKYYFNELKKIFHTMRNESNFWNYWVLGGEYGMEVTGGAWISKQKAEKQGIAYSHGRTTASGKELVRKNHVDGLHIHLHCLLLVRKGRQNRNKLHREILLTWNKLTTDEANHREPFTPEVRTALKRGNKLLTDTDVDNLNPAGATLIGLETIFTIDATTGIKVRGGNEFNSDAMKRAVMETISYHFEPLAFDKEDKEINLPLFVDLLPRMSGVRLYSKFGCLEGETSLNIKESGVSLREDFKEAVKILVDEDTGEVVPEKQYFLCSPALVYHKKKEEDEKDYSIILSNKAKRARFMLKAETTLDAIDEMSGVVKAYMGVIKRKEKD